MMCGRMANCCGVNLRKLCEAFYSFGRDDLLAEIVIGSKKSRPVVEIDGDFIPFFVNMIIAEMT